MKTTELKIPNIVGVLNLSPESLNNQAFSKDEVIDRVKQMVANGADIIDLGAQSTRPNVPQLSLEEEYSRIKGMIGAVKKVFPHLPISIDTTRTEIIDLALNEGVDIVNDISGGRFSADLLKKVAESGASYVLMHSQGEFGEMHRRYEYSDIVSEIKKYFEDRIRVCVEAGIPKEKIILDPGIGFSKAGEQNVEVIQRLSEFHELGFPLYIGLSRKRFIGAIIGEEDSEKRDNATTVFHTLCIQSRVDYIRTHNVKHLKQCAQVMASFTK